MHSIKWWVVHILNLILEELSTMKIPFNKFSWWLLPLFIIISFISLHLYQSIQFERALPSEGWSRSIDLNVESDTKPTWYIRESSESSELISVYVTHENVISKLIVDDSLHVKTQSQLPMNVLSYSDFWANDSTVIYLKESTLIMNNNGTEKILVEGVEGFCVEEDNLVYWMENSIYSLDTSSFSSEKIGETNEKIKSVIVEKDHSSVLVVSTSNFVAYNLTYLQHNGEKQYTPISLQPLYESGKEIINEISFAENDNLLHIVYGTKSSAGGGLTYRGYHMTLDLTSNEQQLIPKVIKLYDESKFSLQDPRNFKIKIKNDHPVILFLAKDHIKGSINTSNIYEATQVNGVWTAERRSKTRELSQEPEWMGEDHIIWIDFSGNDYKILTASTNPTTFAKSQSLTTNDWIYSISYSINSLFNSFFLLLISSVYVLPTFILLLVIYYWNEDMLQGKYKSMLLLLSKVIIIISQIIYITYSLKVPNGIPTIVNDTTTNFILILVLLWFITWFLEWLVTNQEWSLTGRITYFAAVNVLLFVFSFSPYMI
jgi:hypothetical protein